IENILPLIYESSYNGIENKYGGIENNNNLKFEKDIESELEPSTEHKKNTEDGPGIELEENIDIVSKSDNASKNTNNYQCEHLPLICIKIYCEKTFRT
ncbi:5004_t:CDS:2, partial [Gigaspora margarita]